MAASKKDVAKQQVKEDREKVREMYLSGKTVKEIAKETYFSSSYCYAMVRDLAKEKNFAKKAKRLATTAHSLSFRVPKQMHVI